MTISNCIYIKQTIFVSDFVNKTKIRQTFKCTFTRKVAGLFCSMFHVHVSYGNCFCSKSYYCVFRSTVVSVFIVTVVVIVVTYVSVFSHHDKHVGKSIIVIGAYCTHHKTYIGLPKRFVHVTKNTQAITIKQPYSCCVDTWTLCIRCCYIFHDINSFAFVACV